MLFLFCVTLWFVLRGAPCFKVFLCSLSSCLVIPFSSVVTSLGLEGAGLCASRAFVCLFSTCFSLPLGVGGRLRFVIVALTGLFYELFYHVVMRPKGADRMTIKTLMRV